MSRKNISLTIAIILITVIGRLLLVSVPNVSPVAAIALLGGAVFMSRGMAMMVPLVAMLLGDVALQITYKAGIQPFAGFYEHMIWTYLAFASVVMVGMLLRNRTNNWGAIAAAGIGSSIPFFLISNLGVWLSSTVFPKTIGGLLACYGVALPFLQYSVVSNLVFTLIIFSGYQYYQKRLTRTSPANLK